jgi:hypothetical protein
MILYIHDLEHVLNEKNISWTGERFIDSWGIATGILQKFPNYNLSALDDGVGLWIHPKTVFLAFCKENSDRGIARLSLGEEKLLQMDLLKL